MLPCKTKRRTTTNLKTKNNQNCQKIELYGRLTTKELKKKLIRTCRSGKDRQLGRENSQQGGGGWSRLPTFPKTGTTGEQCTQCNPVSALKKKASKPLGVKILGGRGCRRNSQPHRRVHWRDPRLYTKPPTQESSPEGANLLMGRGGSD